MGLAQARSGILVLGVSLSSIVLYFLMRDKGQQPVEPGSIQSQNESVTGAFPDSDLSPVNQLSLGSELPRNLDQTEREELPLLQNASNPRLANLDELLVPVECADLANSMGITKETLPFRIEENLDLRSEFPEEGHLVRWEAAYGLPGPGTVIWMEWNGDQPPSYRVRRQDGRNPNQWDEQGKAPIIIDASNLSREAAIDRVKTLQREFEQDLGPKSYRRLLLTDTAPSEEGPGASLTGEVIQDRILFFSQDGLVCQSVGQKSLSCRCEMSRP